MHFPNNTLIYLGVLFPSSYSMYSLILSIITVSLILSITVLFDFINNYCLILSFLLIICFLSVSYCTVKETVNNQRKQSSIPWPYRPYIYYGEKNMHVYSSSFKKI
uniref:Uncharacterized protein n=1 Tax=Cacopsylla melanoneura TaxID=428564 RepID=A0A8D9DZY7_9HEMI